MRRQNPSLWRCAAVILAGLLLISIGGLFISAAYAEATDPVEYEYQYTVKAEQVNENEMVNESEPYDTLTQGEREMLFKAFKRSDHFLGGASVRTHYDEPIENIDRGEWKIVRVKGVPLLVAIEGPDKVRSSEEHADEIGSVFLCVIGILMICWGLLFTVTGIKESYKNQIYN